MNEREKNVIIKAINAFEEIDDTLPVDDIKPALDRMLPKMVEIVKRHNIGGYKYIKCECGKEIEIEHPITSEEGIIYEKCPVCGRFMLEAGQKFCHNCGQALTPDERGKTYTWDNAVEAGEEFCPIFNKKVMTYYPKDMPAYYRYTPLIVDDEGRLLWCRYDEDEGGWDNTIFVEMEQEEYQYLRLIGQEPNISL